MTKAGDEILAGAQEALEHARGDKSKCISHVIINAEVDVKAIREKTGLNQEDFASSFGLSLASLRNWETKHRQPDSATKAYLAVIATNPNVAREAIQTHFG